MTGTVKVHRLFTGLALILILGQACTENIELFSPGQAVPVVYCLLNPDDSIQYVRVGQTSSLADIDSVIANPEISSLQEDYEVYITSFNDQGEPEIVWFSPLEASKRDSGLFPQEDLQILSAPMKIECSKVYKFYLQLKESGKLVYGELKSFDQIFQVIDPLDVSFRTINLYPGEDFYFRFALVSEKAVYQPILKFKYDEVFQGILTQKILEFPLTIQFSEESDVNFVEKRFSGEFFLREIGRILSPKEGISRIPVGLDFHISAGGEELYYLIKSENRQFGFSSMSMTNLVNAVGVFSSLSHRYINDMKFSKFSIDSLAYSQYTKDLGFEPYLKSEQ